MRRPRGHTSRLRRLAIATAVAGTVAALGAGPAVAGLGELGEGPPRVDAVVTEVTAATSEATSTVTKSVEAAAEPLTSQAQPAPATTPATPLPAAPAPPAPAVTKPTTETITQVTTTVTQTAAPLTTTVEQATTPVATTVQQAAAPVVAAAERTAAPVLRTVERAAEPVVSTVQQTARPLVTAVRQTAAPALEASQLGLTPVVTTTRQVLDPVLSSLTQVTSRLAGARGQATTPGREAVRPAGGPAAQSPGVVQPGTLTVGPELAIAPVDEALTTPFRRLEETAVATPRPHSRAARRQEPGTTSFDPGSWLGATPWSDRETAPGVRPATAAPATPGPLAPTWPFGFSLSAAPFSGGAFFVPLFAALAATFLLAAQGVGRRLRPALAPLRLPVLALSLERPG
jgi:hypothetical protein